ncbi:hypothetical protein E2C01_017115 [Portunus trituberculatus]|uniref:Uncharacterized protein n=1 Tax=Portunus trituberculatus TaxID=210409 RepID=A0A5B7DS27_PORTR|nr:hypothetical protein [Portunus trituberculatus]
MVKAKRNMTLSLPLLHIDSQGIHLDQDKFPHKRPARIFKKPAQQRHKEQWEAKTRRVPPTPKRRLVWGDEGTVESGRVFHLSALRLLVNLVGMVVVVVI